MSVVSLTVGSTDMAFGLGIPLLATERRITEDARAGIIRRGDAEGDDVGWRAVGGGSAARGPSG